MIFDTAASLAVLGSAMSVNTLAAYTGINDYFARNACEPRIDHSRIIQVDVDDRLPYYISNPNPVFNKEGEQWVLIKEDAPIPAWKVALRDWYATRGNPPKGIAEMERIGKAIPMKGATRLANPDIGQDVWIGSGWCDPETGNVIERGGDLPEETQQNVCLDPLVQDVLYVVNKRCNIDGNCATLEEYNDPANYDPVSCDCVPGHPEICLNGNNWLICRAWGEERLLEPEHTYKNTNWYWWSFNIYYRASKLPADPTYEDLPCWIRLLAEQCPGSGDVMGESRLEALHSAQCVPPVLGHTFPDAPRPGLILKRDIIQLNVSLPMEMQLDELYLAREQLDYVDQFPIIGTAFNGHFYVRIRPGSVRNTKASYSLILDPRIVGSDGPFWQYVPVSAVYKPEARSLQLGSFIPGLPTFSYEWWTPSCKPALYLYPEEETELTVKVEPAGHITESIPDHEEEGWNVVAYPDGRIQPINRSTDQPINRTSDQLANSEQRTANYDYLYYEASLTNVTIPKDHGWIKSADALPVFFADILPHLGLNKTETRDFMDYWIPKLTGEGEQWYITLIDRKELDRVEKISFSKQPDTFIRVRFYFEKLDSPNSKSPILSSKQMLNSNYQILNSPSIRSGFTAVDWGGIIGNGSCGIQEYVH